MKKTISLTVTLFAFFLSSFSQAGPYEFSPQMDSIGFKGKSYYKMVANYFGSRHEMILQTSNRNTLRDYIRKQNSSEIFIEAPDFNNHFSDIKSFTDYSSKEKFLTAFEDNNHIYFLTLRKNIHTIRVYTSDGPYTPYDNADELETS